MTVYTSNTKARLPTSNKLYLSLHSTTPCHRSSIFIHSYFQLIINQAFVPFKASRDRWKFSASTCTDTTSSTRVFLLGVRRQVQHLHTKTTGEQRYATDQRPHTTFKRPRATMRVERNSGSLARRMLTFRGEDSRSRSESRGRRCHVGAENTAKGA